MTTSPLSRLLDKGEELLAKSTYSNIRMTPAMRAVLDRYKPVAKKAPATEGSAPIYTNEGKRRRYRCGSKYLPKTVRTCVHHMYTAEQRENIARRAVSNFVEKGWTFSLSAREAQMDIYTHTRIVQGFRAEPWYRSRSNPDGPANKQEFLKEVQP